MTLEQLRIFVAVAEREHVTLAARDLNLTQSATSAAVAALEARYATRLFDRVGRRIALTEAGHLFLAEARAVLARARAAEQTLIDLADLTRGSLTLAASQTIGNYWLPPLIQRYRELHPGVAITLAVDNTDGVARRIHDGAADIGLVEGAVDDPFLTSRPFAEDELVLVAPPDHPWAREPGRQPDDPRRGPWVLREPGSGTRAIFEAALAGLGIAPGALDIALELPSNEAVCSAVAAGAGVTVVSRLVVACALKAGVLTRVKLDLPPRRFFALHHKEYSVTRAQKAFLELIGAG
ncbi:LysR family transcriptional regulator [Rhodoblastus sp.]|uniref:LysR family transcriptional regulator n=1 Tax=Rhodoblastus sp. TaxID=1962975 RepID=UPI0035B0BFB0